MWQINFLLVALLSCPVYFLLGKITFLAWEKEKIFRYSVIRWIGLGVGMLPVSAAGLVLILFATFGTVGFFMAVNGPRAEHFYKGLAQIWLVVLIASLCITSYIYSFNRSEKKFYSSDI